MTTSRDTTLRRAFGIRYLGTCWYQAFAQQRPYFEGRWVSWYALKEAALPGAKSFDSFYFLLADLDDFAMSRTHAHFKMRDQIWRPLCTMRAPKKKMPKSKWRNVKSIATLLKTTCEMKSATIFSCGNFLTPPRRWDYFLILVHDYFCSNYRQTCSWAPVKCWSKFLKLNLDCISHDPECTAPESLWRAPSWTDSLAINFGRP